MIKITLKPKFKIESEMNLKNLSNHRFKRNLIYKTKILYNNQEFAIDKIFEIKIEKNEEIQNELVILDLNKNCDYLGWKWRDGVLRVKSNVGSFLGSEMVAGKILVDGSAEHFVGSQMCGGKIIIKSNVLDFAGSSLPGYKKGMSGGLIIINGNARDYLGFNIRRGILFVKGNVGNHSCNSMVAGTVILKKKVGNNLGFGMKRGTIFLNKKIFSLKNFTRIGEIKNSFFDLLNVYLTRKFGLKIFKKGESLIKYHGDESLDGKGEIIVKK